MNLRRTKLGLHTRRTKDGSNLDLDFRSMSELPSFCTFSRGTLGTCFDSAGVMRFCDHNLLTYSEDFRSTADAGSTRPWIYTGCTVTTNAAVAPDGSSTADKIIRESGSGIRGVRQSYSVTSGQTNTVSFYAKAAEYEFVGVVLYNSQGRVVVNLLTLETAKYATDATVTVTSVGNGWVRCSVTKTWSATGDVSPGFAVQNSIDDPATCPIQGDGTSGIYLWGAQLTQGSYSYPYRATTSSAYYGPRFTHDPATLAPLGYLAEGQRTNLVTYSEQFDNAAWTKVLSTASANSATSPDGAVTADKAIVNSGTSLGLASGAGPRTQISKSASATTYTASVYFKAAEHSDLFLMLAQSSSAVGSAVARFRASDCSVVTAASTTGTFTAASASIASVGNGWCRAVLTATSDTDTVIGVRTFPADQSATTGDGTSGLYIWGAQLEAASFPSSYIPTTTASATRNADSLTITGTAATDRINNAEGTLLVQWRWQGSNAMPSVRCMAGINDGTNNERHLMYGSGAVVSQLVTDGGSPQVISSAGALPAVNTRAVVAAAYKLNDCAVALNGAAAVTDATATMPTCTQFEIGQYVSSGYLFGTIARVKYWPIRLTDAQLASITA